MQTIPTPSSKPFQQTDELYTPVSQLHNQSVAALLTANELAAGCLVYQVPHDALAPDLKRGDYAVTCLIEPDEWANIKPGSLFLLLVQYSASEFGDEPFKAHRLMRVCDNYLGYHGPLMGFEGDEHTETTLTLRAKAVLVEVGLIVRLLPTL